MLTIKIDHFEDCKMDMVNYLEHVASLIDSGYKKGDNWELTGVDEEQYDDGVPHSPEDDLTVDDMKL